MKKGPLKACFLAMGVALVAAWATLASEKSDDKPGTVLFLGDSLTAGYGIEPDYAYPALIQKKIDDAELPWRVIASGLSGETSAGGLRRVDWVMRQPVEVLVLALGANDGLRGIDLKDTRANLQGIIDRAREKSPGIKIVIAGMQMPPNLGEDYTKAFRSLYPELARGNDAVLIPFLLEGVGGDKSLNLSDGIHPNRAGHKIVAENVWGILQPVLSSN